eukprot:TRINITY_DN2886_c0_g1_i1.p1 TRINITY_DN2886_c0_g1~~TRINITY_DN2886_c0_g1_i1.p1  ORF type:complete len:352 (-),score=62.65 TRINITY_DN2886_c0_g1_i1:941-1945(-)
MTTQEAEPMSASPKVAPAVRGASKALEELSKISTELSHIDSKLDGIEQDKKVMEGDRDHLMEDPEGRRKVERLQYRVNWEIEELMRNLMKLDQLLVPEDKRPMRKSLVVQIQAHMDRLDEISKELLKFHDSIPEHVQPPSHEPIHHNEKTQTHAQQYTTSMDTTPSPAPTATTTVPTTSHISQPTPHRQYQQDSDPYQQQQQQQHHSQRAPSYHDPHYSAFRARPDTYGDFKRDAQGKWAPQVDVKESIEAYMIHVHLHGIAKEALELDINRRTGLIELAGPVPVPGEEDQTFSKRFQVPEDVDVARIRAQMMGSILEIMLPRVVRRRRHHRFW